MDEEYHLLNKDSLPQGADFCITLDSDCMEPAFSRGQILTVTRSVSPREFAVGVFLYRGRVYVRQWCEDYAGNLHLLCANPLRESENLMLSRAQRGACLCLGRVILKKYLPMPIYDA